MKRIIPIDVIKGLLLVIITVDHLGSPLKEYTWQSFGYVSATPGFVFLSGVLAGIVYHNKMSIPYFHIAKRMWKLYRYHIGSLFLIFFIYSIFPPNVGYAYYWKTRFLFFAQAPLTAIWQSLVLWYQPDYFNLIPLYILLTLTTPIWAKAFKQSKAIWILGFSFFGWVIAQFNIPWLHQWWHNAFDFLAWQFVFIVGSYVGYHRHSTKSHIQKSKPIVLIILAGVALFLFASRHEFIPAPVFATAKALDRHYLGWLRLTDSAIIAYLIGWVILKFPHLFSNQWLSLLGKHSLQVYTYQTLLLYFSQPLFTRFANWGEWSLTLFVIITVTSLTLPALAHQWYQSHLIPERVKVKVAAFALPQAPKSTKIT